MNASEVIVLWWCHSDEGFTTFLIMSLSFGMSKFRIFWVIFQMIILTQTVNSTGIIRRVGDPFNSCWKVCVLHNLLPNTDHITHCHLELAYQFVLSSRHSPGINFRWYLFNLPSTPPLFVLHPLWRYFSKTLMWCHLYRLFRYIYSPLIEKDLRDRRNISIKFLYVYLCLSSGDLFIFSIRVPAYFLFFFVLEELKYLVELTVYKILNLNISSNNNLNKSPWSLHQRRRVYRLTTLNES